MTKQKNYKENQINLTTGIEKLTKFVIMKKEEILKGKEIKETIISIDTTKL